MSEPKLILLEDAIAMYPAERLFVIGDTQMQIEEFASNNVQCYGVVQRIAHPHMAHGIRSTLPLIILPGAQCMWVSELADRWKGYGGVAIFVTRAQVHGHDPVGVPLDGLGLV